MDDEAIDFAAVDIGTAREVVRLAEVELQGELDLLIGSNQRAATLCGIFTASAVAAVGGAALAYDGYFMAAMWGAIAAGVGLLAGSAFCVAAMWPCGFYLAGYAPGWMVGSRDALFGSLSDTLLNVAALYEERIQHNRRVNRWCANMLRAGAILGCSAPVVGSVVLEIVYLRSGG